MCSTADRSAGVAPDHAGNAARAALDRGVDVLGPGEA